MMNRAFIFVALLLAVHVSRSAAEAMETEKKHHRRHHKHHHHKHHHEEVAHESKANATHILKTDSARKIHAAANTTMATKAKSVGSKKAMKTTVSAVHKTGQIKTISDEDIVNKMRTLEKELAAKEAKAKDSVKDGRIEVNGPLPVDFKVLFAKSVAEATRGRAADVKVIDTSTSKDPQAPDAVMVHFSGPINIVQAVEDQAADPDSRLANGPLHSFLVEGDVSGATGGGSYSSTAAVSAGLEAPSSSVDVDVEMPYGDLEPFGREDTAQELTEDSVKESDAMVDQLERAEVAEEKRAVFRALTRLRGAAITSFDGIARAQTGNIDQYNKLNKWRSTHPLHHLADEEADVSKWAFPDNAD